MIQQILAQYGYLGLFPLVVIEGPMVTVFSGYLVFIGYLDFLPAFITILLGDIMSDIVYYHIGYFAHKSKRAQGYIAKKKFLFENLDLLKSLWKKHPAKTMFFGKQAYLLCGPIIISSGILHIPLGKFLLYTAPVSAFQALILLVLGYYLGTGYELAARYIEYPAIIIALVMVGLFFVFRRIRKIAAQELNQEIKTL